MKRSQINTAIAQAKEFFADHHFMLPPWAFWRPADWRTLPPSIPPHAGGRHEDVSRSEAGRRLVWSDINNLKMIPRDLEKTLPNPTPQTPPPPYSEIIENMLGWDITDFGLGDYDRYGLLLFTIRNGNPKRDKKTYAEKIMLAHEGQETPLHFHWSKMEDIINRGGGNLVIELYGSTEDEKLSTEPVQVSIDGIQREVPAGGRVVLKPGESICLYQGLYHRFYGEPGHGDVLIGEVSQVNDDASDNRFHETVGRFPDVDEDEEPLHLLASDYGRYL